MLGFLNGLFCPKDPKMCTQFRKYDPQAQVMQLEMSMANQ